MRVKVMRVDLDNKKIDFEIEQPASRKTGKPGKKRKRR
ncbi:MAG: hypothetical protein ACLGGU_02440 [Gammaproteobacteria bacterium]